MSADSGSSKIGMGVEAPAPLNGLISTVTFAAWTSNFEVTGCEGVRGRAQIPSPRQSFCLRRCSSFFLRLKSPD